MHPANFAGAEGDRVAQGGRRGHQVHRRVRMEGQSVADGGELPLRDPQAHLQAVAGQQRRGAQAKGSHRLPDKGPVVADLSIEQHGAHAGRIDPGGGAGDRGRVPLPAGRQHQCPPLCVVGDHSVPIPAQHDDHILGGGQIMNNLGQLRHRLIALLLQKEPAGIADQLQRHDRDRHAPPGPTRQRLIFKLGGEEHP